MNLDLSPNAAGHPALAPVIIENLERLHQHISEYEQSVAGIEYDPVKSPQLMEPLLIKEAFDPTVLDDALFLDLFAGMSLDPERAISGLFRVYINGMLSPQYENEVLYTKPLPGEGFEAYVTRATGGHKFGIIVNGAEQWSDTLARMAARVFGPVVEAQGETRSTVEVTLFIGNYGYTPFGIHIDDPYTSVVHFHAGPATKEMTLFGIEEFHRLNGPRKNCFQPETLVPQGRTFAIAPGDVFLLPPHYYHIGSTQGFSIGVAFAVSKYPQAQISKQLLHRAIAEESMLGRIDDLVDRASATGVAMADWLRRAADEFTAQGRSRRQLRYSFLRSPAIQVNPRDRWARDPDFPLVQMEAGDDLLLFARGNRIRLARSELTRQLVASLPHSTFTVEQLHAQCGGRVSIDALSTLVGQIARMGGLRRAPETAED